MSTHSYEQHSGYKAFHGQVPSHVAIIMDGNGRWAQQRGLARSKGHARGKDAVRTVIKASLEREIKVLTLFAFGIENWKRPVKEVRHLFRLLFVVLHRELKSLNQQGIRLKVHGSRSQVPQWLVKAIESAEQATQANQKLQLNIMFNYSGRWDIQQAIEKACLNHEPSPWETFHRHLCLAQYPEPDLLIRTAGVQRISNFMLWDLAYSEFYFTDCYWPEFNDQAFDRAIAFYQCQERRFGLISDQVEQSYA